ncbi:MAG: NUDIX domain-containing protein [Defluviitaleaceae bacterium]|nr:NUDIX domain-containing protein [Defluviitaleaceae bacterium]
MAEFCDIYDINRNKTGRLHERGKPDMKEGDCLLAVIVWVMNSKNEFLISKRSDSRWKSGMWQSTSGCAVAGDDSLTAALREVKEELGVTLDPSNGQMFKQHNGDGLLFDEWLFCQEFDINDVVLQPDETCDAMWASRERISELIVENNFMNGESFNLVCNCADY